MTELSVQYACSPTVGDYGPLTAENLAEMNLYLGNINNQNGGVIYWTDPTRVPRISTATGTLSNAVDGLLEPTESGGIVSIDTGVALVNGYLYFNDVVVDFDIDGNPGAANATDIIALRWTASGQTVRLVRLNGSAGNTAVLTQSSTTWDIPLAEVLLDGSGQFSALTDVRQLSLPTGTIVKLDTYLADGTTTVATFNNIAALFNHLEIKGYTRTDAAATQFTTVDLIFNNDSSAIYSEQRSVFGNVTTYTQLTGQTQFIVARTGGAIQTAGVFDMFTARINNYRSAVASKVIQSMAGNYAAATVTSLVAHGWYISNDPITRIDIDNGAGANFVAGSLIELYGIV